MELKKGRRIKGAEVELKREKGQIKIDSILRAKIHEDIFKVYNSAVWFRKNSVVQYSISRHGEELFVRKLI